MVAPVIYRSDDGSAPSLDYSAGSMIALLDAILVNGYGAKAAAGWTKAYSGTNKAAYRTGSGHQRYLRVDDTGTQMARVVGYGAMTDVDIGTDAFPTTAQFSGGMYVRKSVTTDATVRSWLAAATDGFLYLIVGSAVTTVAGFSGGDAHLAFGDFEPVLLGDRYNTLIFAATNSSTSDTTSALAARASISNFSATGHYAIGGGSQIPKACSLTTRSVGVNSQSSAGVAGAAVPNPAGGKVHLSRISIVDSSSSSDFVVNNALRGWLPGLWAPDHIYSGVTTLDTVSGASGSTLDGKNFLIVKTAGTNCVVIETNGGW